jgi:hypothetical protein
MSPQSEKDWGVYRAAVAAAKARGLCFPCRHESGFAAVDAANGKPRLPLYCAKCVGRAKP